MENRLIVTLNIDELKQLINDCILGIQSHKVECSDELYLKRAEVAKMFGVSLVTLNQWRKEGLITRYKIKSRVFFKKSEIMKVLDSK